MMRGVMRTRPSSHDPSLVLDLVVVVGVVGIVGHEESEFGVISLLVFGHGLEFGTISSHELGQFVDDVLQLGV